MSLLQRQGEPKTMAGDNKSALIAMSGGVDSSVAAYLMKYQGYRCMGITMRLTQKQLSGLQFPLGEIRKENTREIAESLKLCNAEKHDSQDICFVPDGNYAAFMEQYTGKKYPGGPIVDGTGKTIGTHHGIVRYTNGQRKGLGIAAGNPLYVTGKDMDSNTLFVGSESDLYADLLYAEDINWISILGTETPMRVKAKTRYRQKEQWATVYPQGGDRIKLIFDESQRAITTGQAVVMYDGDIVVGGGTITAVSDTKNHKMEEQSLEREDMEKRRRI